MHRHTIIGWSLLLLLSLALPPAIPAQADERCFSTGFCISGRIREFWEQNDGERVFGLPIGPLQDETVGAKTVKAQWFQRDRLELHADTPRPYDVQLGHLGTARLVQQGRPPADVPRSEPRADCRYVAETGHNVCGRWWEAYRASGVELDGQPGRTEAENLALFGLPLGEAQAETISGVSREVQWFERARFEQHLGETPPFDIQFGLLGNEIKASTPPPAVPTPVAPPVPPAVPEESPYDGVWTVISSYLDKFTIVVDRGSVRHLAGEISCWGYLEARFSHEEGLITNARFFVRTAPDNGAFAMTGLFESIKRVEGTAVAPNCRPKLEFGWVGSKIAAIDRPDALKLDGQWKGGNTRGETVTFVVKDGIVTMFEVGWRRQDDCVMTLTTPIPIVGNTLTVTATHPVGKVNMFGTFRTNQRLVGEGRFEATRGECSNPGHRFFKWSANKAEE